VSRTAAPAATADRVDPSWLTASSRYSQGHHPTLETAMPARIDFAKLDLMDALDLAVLIEVEAFERYRMFSTQLGHRFPGDAASAFTRMAENEAKHGQQLAERRKELFGDAPVRVKRDDLFDVEAPDQGSPRTTMSALQAFEVALASEQKAYDFYDRALEHVTNPEIKELFAELRDEETEHVRMVKEIIAALPASARIELGEEEDDYPAL
jgi:rubrerythrin